MAVEKVGVVDEEYKALCSNYREVQNSFMKEIETVISRIGAINCRGGGFYVENVTPNITKLLLAINNIKSTIEKMQESEIEIIESFVRTIDNVDTCC